MGLGKKNINSGIVVTENSGIDCELVRSAVPVCKSEA